MLCFSPTARLSQYASAELKNTWIRIGTASSAITSGCFRIASPWNANSSTSVASSAAIDHGPILAIAASNAACPAAQHVVPNAAAHLPIEQRQFRGDGRAHASTRRVDHMANIGHRATGMWSGRRAALAGLHVLGAVVHATFKSGKVLPRILPLPTRVARWRTPSGGRN